jgi:hypothetical protein
MVRAIAVIIIETGMITPPVVLNVFVVKWVAEGVSLGTIFRGVLPFWFAMVVCLALIVLFPQIALIIPSSMFRWNDGIWHKIPVFIAGEKGPLAGASRTLLFPNGVFLFADTMLTQERNSCSFIASNFYIFENIRKNGAGDEIRTHDPYLGKVMLYP